MNKRIIGYFPQNIIDLLDLDIRAGTPIYIADSNIEHMRTSHPEDFAKYGCDIEDIIANPDYVGKMQRMTLLNSPKNIVYPGIT